MASAIYPKFKEAILQATANSSLGGTVKVALVDTGTYTYSAAHEFYSSLTGIVGPAQASQPTLATKTFVNGLFDAQDVTFTGVSGVSVEALVIYVDTGTAATSRLVAFVDSFTAVTPNGGDITITWNASGIFQL
jgi:hypothetical protein